MTTDKLPPLPQANVSPLALPDDQEQRLLNRRRKADQTDPFASDPDDEIRRLGKLALRRDILHPYDYLALGDLCARRSLVGQDRRLLIYYAGKALVAYRRARDLSDDNGAAAELASSAFENYVRWLVHMTRAIPTRRNIGVAFQSGA